ncbi:hypothetical protein RhiTH_010880 [Rhizoctonia solani]
MLPALLTLVIGATASLTLKPVSKPPTCVVPSHQNANISDTSAVHAAFKKCGKGGRIIFSENTNYTLRELTDTVAYLILKDWSHSTLISKTGKGLIDGLGQLWWDAAAGEQVLFPKTLRRPVLIALDGANNVTVDNIAMKNPAMWFNWVIDSKNVLYKNIRLSALSANKNPPANADGWDTYRTSHFELRDSHVVSGDDCFSFKGNSTYVNIENVYCQNSHGISVGSLAQYPGVLDIVEHVKVKNITFVGDGGSSNNGARIKVWSGPVGTAIVNDIHYEDLLNSALHRESL